MKMKNEDKNDIWKMWKDCKDDNSNNTPDIINSVSYY